VTWQLDLHRDMVARLPEAAEVRVAGSASTPHLLDGWSDLDLRLTLHRGLLLSDVVGSNQVWAMEETVTSQSQVLRIIFEDGRWLDLAVDGPGRIQSPILQDSNSFRFVAALAVVKLGRNDRLIGLHLVLELWRSCLVQAMLLRDRDSGTSVHPHGTNRDAMADDLTKLAALSPALTPRPNVVERTAAVYDRWRQELDPDYQPDWSGLSALLERGLGTVRPAIRTCRRSRTGYGSAE